MKWLVGRNYASSPTVSWISAGLVYCENDHEWMNENEWMNKWIRWIDYLELFVFRCVRQERISIRGSVRPSLRPSVPPSVGPYACAITAFLGCFRPRWDPTLKQMIIQHVLRVLSPVCSSICLFIHMSHDQYTLRHSPDASLPGRACFRETAVYMRRRELFDQLINDLHTTPKISFQNSDYNKT